MPIYFNPASADMPLTVDSIGRRWPQEPIDRPGGFHEYHWLATERGAGELSICGRKLTLPEGAGVMIAPFTPHAYRAAGGAWTTSFVTFTGALAADIGKVIGSEPYIRLKQGETRALQAWIDDVVARHEAQRLDPFQLSVDCYALLMNLKGARAVQEDFSSPLYQKYVAPVIKQIETHYDQDIAIEQLAGAVYVSPQYLIRLFRRFLGLSPHRYLINARINRAKELLVNRPGMEIQQVCARVGYRDASHFIAAFRAATGCTPLAFRRYHRQ